MTSVAENKNEQQNLYKLIRILLIEDNPGDARLIKEYLSDVKNIAFDLKSAERLHVGIEILEYEFIDIVLLDLKLPDSEGLDSFDEIFAIAPSVPIIVLTGL